MADFSKGAAWIRGEIVPIGAASINVGDWGVIHSDITYDVVPVWDGAFFRLDDYMDRFAASMAAMRLAVPEDRAAIRAALHAIVARSGLRRAYVAMVASRGAPIVPGTRDPRQCANHFYAWCVPFVWVFSEDVVARGASLWIAKSVRRIPADSVNPRAKNYHWGDFTAGLFEAKDNGFDNVALLDHDGDVTEGPGFNVFAVIDGKLVTPAAGCLEGVTRRTVLEIAEELGVAAETRALPLRELMDADEVFVSTSGGGVAPIVRVDERIFSNGAEGPVTARLRRRYWEWIQRDALRQPVDYGDA